VKKELAGLVIASVIVVAFLAPIASLYSPSSLLGLSNPMTGIWGSIDTSMYPQHDTIMIPGMQNNATVLIDTYGVPHIFTQSEFDLAYIVGYLHAHDRLFQMDLQRRLVEGRLSEVTGNVTYDVDRLYRTIGLYRGASKIIDVLTNISDGRPISYFPQLDVSLAKADAASVLTLAQAYCNGVNYEIQQMELRGSLPVEFKLLQYVPEPWTLQNVFETDRLITWGLTGGFDDLYLYQLQQGLIGRYGVTNGTKYLLEYYPIDREIDHFIIPDGENISHVVLPSDPPDGANMAQYSESFSHLGQLLKWVSQVSQITAPLTNGFASNDWVVGGNLTTTGRPIVCNDPHLQLSDPPVWYELQYVTNSPSGLINARGFSFPGIGFIVIGSNQYVGWGVTNVMADQIDFYYYNWNGAGQYWYKGNWRNVQQETQQILVKTDSGMASHTFVLNYTTHGPVLERAGVRFAVTWMGERYGSTEGIAIYKYTHAKNANELLKGTYYWQQPPQNFVFADIYGNFGYRPAGWYVNRTYPDGKMAINASNPMTALIARLPINGSSATIVEWNTRQWIDPNEVPTLWNPKAGYVVTANNRISNKTYPYIYDMAWTYADYHRAYRIDSLINQTITANGKISPDDMKRIQNDVFEVPASTLVPKILQAYAGGATGDTQAALAYFAGWNYTMLPGLVAPLVFTEWLQIFKNMTFADELIDINETVPGFYISTSDLDTFIGYLPTSSIETLTLFDPNNHWFNNVLTHATQNATQVIRASFEKTVELMKTKYVNDVTNWPTYSVAHQLQIDHPLLSLLDYPHLPARGGSDCVDAIGSGGDVGPSMREILNLANLNQSFCILPGGQSGSPFSSHYYDQLGMWLNGQYKQMSFPATPEEVTNVESVLDFIVR
jgi:penicillin amidase